MYLVCCPTYIYLVYYGVWGGVLFKIFCFLINFIIQNRILLCVVFITLNSSFLPDSFMEQVSVRLVEYRKPANLCSNGCQGT
jgi:hypothetical protein